MSCHLKMEIIHAFNLGMSGGGFLHSVFVCCERWTQTARDGDIWFVSHAKLTQSELARLMAVRSKKTVHRAATICEAAGLVSVKRSRKCRRDSESGETFYPSNIYTVSIPARFIYLHEEQHA